MFLSTYSKRGYPNQDSLFLLFWKSSNLFFYIKFSKRKNIKNTTKLQNFFVFLKIINSQSSIINESNSFYILPFSIINFSNQFYNFQFSITVLSSFISLFSIVFIHLIKSVFRFRKSQKQIKTIQNDSSFLIVFYCSFNYSNFNYLDFLYLDFNYSKQILFLILFNFVFICFLSVCQKN